MPPTAPEPSEASQLLNFHLKLSGHRAIAPRSTRQADPLPTASPHMLLDSENTAAADEACIIDICFGFTSPHPGSLSADCLTPLGSGPQ